MNQLNLAVDGSHPCLYTYCMRDRCIDFGIYFTISLHRRTIPPISERATLIKAQLFKNQFNDFQTNPEPIYSGFKSFLVLFQIQYPSSLIQRLRSIVLGSISVIYPVVLRWVHSDLQPLPIKVNITPRSFVYEGCIWAVSNEQWTYSNFHELSTFLVLFQIQYPCQLWRRSFTDHS